MSTIKTNTLTGVTTSGSISVTGEGNSTTTNLQQGLAKFWCHTTTSTSVDSLNQGSITDAGTGNYTHNFTNNMNNDAYAGGTVGTSGDHVSSGTHSTSAVNFQHFNQSNSSVDCDTDQTVHGDLA
tara:strand:- start:42 stop:416 length:375 start_codon:yes stop_codon:yes gene_type:complete